MNNAARAEQDEKEIEELLNEIHAIRDRINQFLEDTKPEQNK